MDLFRVAHGRSIAKNTFSQLIVKGFSSSVNLLATFIIFSSLGMYEFGSFTKIVTFVSLFYLVLDFGLNAVFLKRHFHHVTEHLKHLYSLRLLLSIVIFFLILVVTFFLPYNSVLNIGFSPQEKFGIVIFSLTVFPYAFILTLNAVLQKKLSYEKLILPNIVASLILVAGVVFGASIKNLYIIFLSYSLSYIVLFLFLSRELKSIFSFETRISHLVSISKPLFIESLPLAFILFLNLIYAKADIMILSFMKSNIDVGIYGFSYRIFEFAIAIPTFFANSIYPILLQEHQKTGFTHLVRRYAYALFGVSFLFLAILLFASPILSFLKQDFSYSVYPLQLLSLSIPFFFLTSLFQWVLIVKNKKMILVAIYFVSMILNIALNIIFIPMYSYIASAIITIVCEGLVFVLMILYLILEKRKFFLIKN